MDFKQPLYTGVFIRRDNRFSATVKIGHRLVSCFVPNSGRLKELLRLGKEVLVQEIEQPNRKTDFDLLLVRTASGLVSVDSRLPNRLFKEEFLAKNIPFFNIYTNIRHEVRYRNSRFDFKLSNPIRALKGKIPDEYFLELKSVTLVRGHEIAMFPDAPTSRGTRHLSDLIHAKHEGFGAGILFCIQREDADYFTPYADNDPDFTTMLKMAKNEGVDVMAYLCVVDEETITMAEPIPVKL
jgi:sugar fermentation stimulation protein A